MKIKHIAIGLSLFGAVGVGQSAFGAWCPVSHTPAQINPWIKPHFVNLNTQNTNAMANLQKSMMDSIKEASGTIIEGRRVVAMQEKINAETVGRAIGKNVETEMNVRHALNTQEKITEAVEEFSPQSVGHRPCAVIEDIKKVEKAQKVAKASVPEMTQDVTARSGHYANRAEAMARILTLHDEKYCTQDQADSGLCKKVGKRAGANLTANTLFLSAKKGDDTDQDKDAFIDLMVGLPDDPVPASQINTTVAIDYQDKKRQKDSIKSIAVHGLKYLQAQNTEMDASAVSEHKTKTTDPTAEGNTEGSTAGEAFSSYSGMVKRDIQRHFGGSDEYKARKKYLASATEKGVMIEIIKADGLLLRELADLYEAKKISLSLTAGQTVALMKYLGMDAKVEEARQKAVRQRLNSIVSSANKTPEQSEQDNQGGQSKPAQ